MGYINLKRGDIVYADLNPVLGSEQGGTRPALVIQNNIGNQKSPTTIVAPITKRQGKAIVPTHLYIGKGGGCLREESVVLFEQIRTIDKKRIKRKLGHLDTIAYHKQIDECLEISVGLNTGYDILVEDEDLED